MILLLQRSKLTKTFTMDIFSSLAFLILIATNRKIMKCLQLNDGIEEDFFGGILRNS